MSIHCVFASGSQATGCHVKINGSFIQMNITRSGSLLLNTAEQTVTGIAQGSYEVFVFDWERDGSLAFTPSYVGHVNVTEPNLLTSLPSPTITGRLLLRLSFNCDFEYSVRI